MPDFTIDDAETGIVYYWEHFGLRSHAYRERWEQKKAWYAAQGITESGGENGTLIVTEDDQHGGIDSGQIRRLLAVRPK